MKQGSPRFFNVPCRFLRTRVRQQFRQHELRRLLLPCHLRVAISDYYHFLLMEFVKRGYRVARCECCGRFFCPKTKKRTLYCDRILKDEKNCKHWGPILKHQLAAGQSKVIEEFDRARQKMYKRYERTRDVLHTKTDKSLTPAQLWYWIESATAARDAYLRGELSEDDALAVIHADPQEE